MFVVVLGVGCRYRRMRVRVLSGVLVRVRTRRNSQVVTEGRNQGRDRSGLKWLGQGRKRGQKGRGSGVQKMVGFRHRFSRGAVPLRLARPLPSPAPSNLTHPRNAANL